MKVKKIYLFLIGLIILSGCTQLTDPADNNGNNNGDPIDNPGDNTNDYYADMALTEAVSITLWDINQLSDFRGNLVNSFMQENPMITVTYVEKDGADTLREDFQASPSSVDVLLTVSDHFGPFVSDNLIEPIDDYVDTSLYVESIEMNNKVWAVPFSSGNHLMLIYNKSLIATPPVNTNELLSMGAALTSGDNYGLVYNRGEPFWLMPWYGGFGGQVFEADGVTPNLNTDEMIDALTFEKSLDSIMPNLADYQEGDEGNYNIADRMFKSGQAAMIINGDWSLGSYDEEMGDNLGVTKIPMISSTGVWPRPYISGHGFCVRSNLSENQKIAIAKLITFFTSNDNQESLISDENTFPGLLSAFSAPVIESDEILKGSAEQVEVGIPMPTVLEMRGVWDAMKPNYQLVVSGVLTPTQAAAQMQTDALNNIANQ